MVCDQQICRAWYAMHTTNIHFITYLMNILIRCHNSGEQEMHQYYFSVEYMI